MSQANRADQIYVQIGGDVSGQVAIGNNILQIGDVHGGVVNILQPDKKPIFSQRAGPVFVRPRPFPGFLNREQELGAAVDALRIGTSISIYGENGFGKTTLLRQLAYKAPGDNFPHGVVYFPTHRQMVEDLLQIVFDHFYESDSIVKPTDAELRQFLQGIQALILLDDVQLTYDEVTELVNAVPQCVFILASPERCLWGEGRCIELQGLPKEAALTLIARELGRELTPEERAKAERLCQLSDGQPLFMIQAASLVRDGKPFEEIISTFQVSEDKLGANIFAKLNDTQRAILSLLTALKNVPLPTRHLAALTGADDIEAQLKTLLELRLVQAHSPAYSLTGSIALPVARLAGATDWEKRSLNYFANWIRQNPPLPDVTDVLDLILSLLERANQDGRWDDVISLGRGIEKILVLNKRWQAWRQVLEWMLKAARSLSDQATQAWALHQLGTRSLCLGDLSTAQQILTQALGIRESIGDKAGAAITRHNLGLISAPPAPPRETPRTRSKPASGKRTPPMLKAMIALMGFAVVAIVLILIWVFVIQPPTVTPPPIARAATKVTAPVVPVATKTKTPTRKPPTPTRTPTKTRTPSPTIPPCNPGVWYCENFQDNKAQEWELEPGWLIQKEGLNYLLNGSGHKWASLTDHEWSDFRVKFLLRLWEGTIHLNYRIMPDPGYEGLVRYYVGFHQNGLYLTKSEHGGSWRGLTSVEFRHTLGDWHTVEIAGWGGHIAVYVDGRLELQYVDDDYLRSGSIAFETLDNSSAQVDDIEVMGSGEEPSYSYELPPPGGGDSGPDQSQPDSGDGGENSAPAEPLPVVVTCSMTTEKGFDRPGMDITVINLGSIGISPVWERCADECYRTSNCQAYTVNQNTTDCWLKYGQPNQVPISYLVSGIKVCK